MKSISVVVPTYNVAGYLEDTLADLAEQTRDFELWIIDDQSDDDSAQIAADFVKGRPDFHAVVLPTHQGIGAARNYGIDHATKQAIAFIDGDDRINSDFIETLSDLFSDADIVATATGFTWWRSPRSRSGVQIIDQATMFDEVSQHGTEIGGYVWNKAFSKAALDSIDLRYDESLPIAEDYLFTASFVAKTPGKYAYDPRSLYTKINRPNSTIHSASFADRRIEDGVFRDIHKMKRLIK